jgi:hypothetical protein
MAILQYFSVVLRPAPEFISRIKRLHVPAASKVPLNYNYHMASRDVFYLFLRSTKLVILNSFVITGWKFYPI